MFCSADAEWRSLFVEVTPATASEATAVDWLLESLAELVPDEYGIALDLAAVRCRGREWWTVESRPASGPGPGTRELWRFDVSEALRLDPLLPFDVDPRPGCPPAVLEAVEEQWRAGRIRDADHDRLLVLARAEAAAVARHATRARAAPRDAPRVELDDEERFAVMMLTRHVARLLVPLIDNDAARALLCSSLLDVEEQAGRDAAEAIAELRHDLDELPGAE